MLWTSRSDTYPIPDTPSPDNPHTPEPQGVGVLLAIIAVAIVWGIVYNRVKKSYMQVEGLIAGEEWTTQYDGRFGQQVRLYTIRFKTQGGRSMEVKHKALIAAKKGDRVKVFYNPTNPKRIIVEAI